MTNVLYVRICQNMTILINSIRGVKLKLDLHWTNNALLSVSKWVSVHVQPGIQWKMKLKTHVGVLIIWWGHYWLVSLTRFSSLNRLFFGRLKINLELLIANKLLIKRGQIGCEIECRIRYIQFLLILLILSVEKGATLLTPKRITRNSKWGR